MISLAPEHMSLDTLLVHARGAMHGDSKHGTVTLYFSQQDQNVLTYAVARLEMGGYKPELLEIPIEGPQQPFMLIVKNPHPVGEEHISKRIKRLNIPTCLLTVADQEIDQETGGTYLDAKVKQFLDTIMTNGSAKATTNAKISPIALLLKKAIAVYDNPAGNISLFFQQKDMNALNIVANELVDRGYKSEVQVDQIALPSGKHVFRCVVEHRHPKKQKPITQWLELAGLTVNTIPPEAIAQDGNSLTPEAREQLLGALDKRIAALGNSPNP